MHVIWSLLFLALVVQPRGQMLLLELHRVLTLKGVSSPFLFLHLTFLHSLVVFPLFVFLLVAYQGVFILIVENVGLLVVLPPYTICLVVDLD